MLPPQQYSQELRLAAVLYFALEAQSDQRVWAANEIRAIHRAHNFDRTVLPLSLEESILSGTLLDLLQDDKKLRAATIDVTNWVKAREGLMDDDLLARYQQVRFHTLLNGSSAGHEATTLVVEGSRLPRPGFVSQLPDGVLKAALHCLPDKCRGRLGKSLMVLGVIAIACGAVAVTIWNTVGVPYFSKMAEGKATSDLASLAAPIYHSPPPVPERVTRFRRPRVRVDTHLEIEYQKGDTITIQDAFSDINVIVDPPLNPYEYLQLDLGAQYSRAVGTGQPLQAAFTMNRSSKKVGYGGDRYSLKLSTVGRMNAYCRARWPFDQLRVHIRSRRDSKFIATYPVFIGLDLGQRGNHVAKRLKRVYERVKETAEGLELRGGGGVARVRWPEVSLPFSPSITVYADFFRTDFEQGGTVSLGGTSGSRGSAEYNGSKLILSLGSQTTEKQAPRVKGETERVFLHNDGELRRFGMGGDFGVAALKQSRPRKQIEDFSFESRGINAVLIDLVVTYDVRSLIQEQEDFLAKAAKLGW